MKYVTHLKAIFSLIAILCCAGFSLAAQDKSKLKFGKLTNADFDLTKTKYDSGAAAVIIADIGNTSFVGNNTGSFSMVFTRHKRVKIITKNGFDVATQSISLYGSGADKEKLSNFRASTFNLENGVIAETKMDEKSLFTEKVSKEFQQIKFTLPALKEGSIFELSYTVTSEYFTHLRSWSFQGDYPCLWSEYEVIIPGFFKYVSLNQGDDHFEVNTTKSVLTDYMVHDDVSINSNQIYRIQSTAVDHRWVKKDVPALKYENYTTTIRNHVSKVSFQLHYIQYGESAERHNYMTDWYEACDKLLKDDNFGIALDFDNHWMKEPLAAVTAGATSDEAKAKLIFKYLRDNFSCTDHDALLAESSLKDVYKKKNGNVAEINLLLTAMLRHTGLKADPVILSTRDNGYADPTYPLIAEYNYVVCRLQLANKTLNLDASCACNGFGFLPSYCYNGEGREINKATPYTVGLFPDSLRETRITTVFIMNDEKGNSSGSYHSLLSSDESYNLRKTIRETSAKEYFKKIQNEYGSTFQLESMAIDSLDSLEKPVQVRYDFNLKDLLNNDLVYINPMFDEVQKKNPFQSEKREYPVEMPYTSNQTYILNMQIPEGYAVDDIPKSVRIKYNENEGLFEYLVGQSENMLQLRVTFKFNKTVIPVEDYSSVRDFFAGIVKKEGEQIVLKKMKQ